MPPTRRVFAALLCAAGLCASACDRPVPYDRARWLAPPGDAPSRAQMVDDVLRHRLPPALPARAVRALLGPPAFEQINFRLPPGKPLPDSLLADAPYRAGRAPDPRLAPRLNAYFHRYGAADTLLVYPLNAQPVVAYRYLVVKCAAGRTQGWVATRFAPLTRPSLPDEPGPWGGF